MSWPNLMYMLSSLTSDVSVTISPDAEFLYGIKTLMLNYCTIVLFSSFHINTLESDEKSGWAKLQRTMPLSGNTIVGSKLIGTAIVVGIFTLYCIIVNVVTSIGNDGSIEVSVMVPICVGLFQFAILCPVFPLSLKFGSKYANSLYLTIEIIMVIVMVVGTFIYLDEIMNNALLYIACPVIAAVSASLSALSGKKLIQRDM